MFGDVASIGQKRMASYRWHPPKDRRARTFLEDYRVPALAIRPPTRPKPTRNPSPWHHPVMTTSSPSSRKVRLFPQSSVNGFRPFQLSSSKLPKDCGVGPLIVPEPIKSPIRVLHPETVWWASCWAMLQYKYLKLVREIVVETAASLGRNRTSRCRSTALSPL